jgi:hypothetical protein
MASKQVAPAKRVSRAVARQAELRRAATRRARSPWLNRWALGGLAAALLLTIAGVVVLRQDTDRATPTPAASAAARSWRDAALVDLRPLTGNVVSLGRTATDWQAGRVTAAVAGQALAVDLQRLAEARAAIGQQQPLPTVPRALSDFQVTAALYLEAARVLQQATEVPSGPLRIQLQHQFSRLRTLADRFFDQADVELQKVLGPPRAVEGVEIRRSADVPDWRSLDLAVGPPLDVAQQHTALRAYQASRPQVPFSEWQADVTAARVPSAIDERTAVLDGSAEQLRLMARQMVAAADVLHDSPDPTGERVVSTRIQLALLVHAEALRAAQAAHLVPTASLAGLTQVAKELAGIADSLWDNRLGKRSTELPAIAP